MQRRAATVPKRIRLTEAGLKEIQGWADAHGTSFSAAVETLCQLGMGRSIDEALAPAVVSVIRREVQSHYDRMIRLILYGIVEAGVATRMASAAVKYQRQDHPGVYEKIREQALKDARRSLGRAKIGKVMEELYGGHEPSGDE